MRKGEWGAELSPKAIFDSVGYSLRVAKPSLKRRPLVCARQGGMWAVRHAQEQHEVRHGARPLLRLALLPPDTERLKVNAPPLFRPDLLLHLLHGHRLVEIRPRAVKLTTRHRDHGKQRIRKKLRKSTPTRSRVWEPPCQCFAILFFKRLPTLRCTMPWTPRHPRGARCERAR